MKKLTSFALAFALCAASAVSAFAANPTSGATTIKTNIQPTYTVEIPAQTSIPFNATSTPLATKLGLSKAQLDPNHKVTVTATVNALKNDADANKTIPFTLHNENGSAFTSAEFTDTNKKVQLSVHIAQTAWDAAPAGNYTGSVTFNIAYGG
ncbi:hypothetical protein [uncultured Gemmiger sp.]|uniref:hypothetical protein n=1 Tax=uncultured Gemmiger sp. TaxID=1623490 RepID=UPI0027DCF854|nr:hypothetical protein [uncultured Gemmiger sp.]